MHRAVAWNQTESRAVKGSNDSGPLWELTPGARTGLEPAPLLVNAGSGCSAVAKPSEAAIIEPVTCWYPSGIE